MKHHGRGPAGRKRAVYPRPEQECGLQAALAQERGRPGQVRRGRALQEPVGAGRGLESAGGREVGCPGARVCGRGAEVHAAPLAGRGDGAEEVGVRRP